MNALASYISGLCWLPNGRVVSVVESESIAEQDAHFVISNVEDWVVVAADSEAAVLAHVIEKHRATRALLNIQTILLGVSADTALALSSESHELLGMSGVDDFVRNWLLCAPLKDAESLDKPIELALSHGLGALADVLEDLREAQPLMNRLVAAWHSIPDGVFDSFAGGRQSIWRLGVQFGAVRASLDLQRPRIERAWAQLAFQVNKPTERAGITRIAKDIAASLCPDHAEAVAAIDSSSAEEEEEAPPPPIRARAALNARGMREQAQRQVDAVATAVAEGNDLKARKFRDELVANQTSYEDGHKHAVKSLCNIAKRCAELFRTDFESECLLEALQLIPTDGWTLIQLGDHFKRVGKYQEALTVLAKAEDYGDPLYAWSIAADVRAQMGEFAEAIRLYEAIPEHFQSDGIQMAKADILRRWGYLEAAEREYDSLLGKGVHNDRILAGKAEIAKRRGDLRVAEESYRALLRDWVLDRNSGPVYRMALSNVLSRSGKLAEAYRLADEVVQERPFSRQAKAARAAIGGLLGNASSALDDIPRLGQARAFDSWAYGYTRGLLLLLLDRHVEARDTLVGAFEARLWERDAESTVRLGAAVWFLSEKNGAVEAQRILEKVGKLEDMFAESIRHALTLHIATLLNDKQRYNELSQQVSRIRDHDIIAWIGELRNNRPAEAAKLAVRTLLRLVA